MKKIKEETNFQKKVYSLCRLVPKGRVTTYKEIGRALGGKGQVYRAVGVALSKSSHSPRVPCHRVVNSNGSVGGFAHGVSKKISLLQKEGVYVRNGRVVDFDKILFKFKRFK
ncbi:MAG: MGMT family protein [Candidatus Woesearchaeota archaeon]